MMDPLNAVAIIFNVSSGHGALCYCGLCRFRHDVSEDALRIVARVKSLNQKATTVQPARDLSRVAVRTCPISGLESHR